MISARANFDEVLADLDALVPAALKAFKKEVRSALAESVEHFFLHSPALTHNYRANLSTLISRKRIGGHIVRRWRKPGSYAAVAAQRRKTILAAVARWEEGPVEFENLAEHAGVVEYGGPSRPAVAAMSAMEQVLENRLNEIGELDLVEWNPKSAR